jgi:hypothetical protein
MRLFASGTRLVAVRQDLRQRRLWIESTVTAGTATRKKTTKKSDLERPSLRKGGPAPIISGRALRGWSER